MHSMNASAFCIISTCCVQTLGDDFWPPGFIRFQAITVYRTQHNVLLYRTICTVRPTSIPYPYVLFDPHYLFKYCTVVLVFTC